MMFNSATFLFLFLPAFLTCFFLMREERRRRVVLLGGSVLFYIWSEPVYFFCFVASALADWLLVRGYDWERTRRYKRALLVAGIVNNIGFLAVVKYLGFFTRNVNEVFSWFGPVRLPVVDILLPIAISFVVFEKITYLVDTYSGKSAPCPKFRQFLTYVFYFPKLLAGPIIKYHDIREQLLHPRVTTESVYYGAARFTLGMFKKAVLADSLAPMVDKVFGDAGHIDFQTAWVGALAFAFQIYFDFSGYSDMAIGISSILGVRLLENFNLPYWSWSITEFWRRWHISLTSWIREYLYIPLGGNRVSPTRTLANLWICFLISGLWHGARWTFIAWGGYHGALLCWERIRPERWVKPPRVLKVALTFYLVLIGWVFFRSESFGDAFRFLKAMHSLSPSASGFFLIYKPGYAWGLLLLAGLVAGVEGVGRIPQPRSAWAIPFSGLCLGLFILCCGCIVSSDFHPFLYFRF